MFTITTQTILTFTLISISCFGIYHPGVYGPFIFDDISNITKNSLIQIQNLSQSSIIASGSSGEAGPLKRPISMLSFALNYYFSGGYSTSVFKTTNIIIHCLNATLVFVLCLQLFKRAAMSSVYFTSNTPLFWFASGIGLIWAVHPINLTSVLYVVQRMTSLSTLFSLGCVIFYLSARNRWLSHSYSSHVGGLFCASIISLLLALFSKENAVLIPIIILLIEMVLYSNEKPWYLINKLSKQQKLIGSAIIITLTISALLWAIDYAAGGFNSRPFTMAERVLTESRVLCFYLSLILVPRINGFGLFHDDIAISSSLFSPWTTITSIAFIIALLATAFYYRKRKPLFALGIGWFFIGHLLESTFFPLEIAHEHRNNLPSIGIILAAVSLIPIDKLRSKKVTSGFLLILLILGSSTWLRAKQWGNYQSLAYYEAAHHPNSPAIQALLSNAANQAGDISVATQAIRKAMELEPKETAYAMHYQNILAIHGKAIPSELQQETLRRIKHNRLTPSTQLALDQIAGCLKKEPCEPLKNNYLEWINAVIDKKPNNATYPYLKGKALRAMGQDLAALNAFQTSHNLSGNFMHPLFEMVDILLRMGQINQAERIVSWIEEANEKTTFRRDNELKKLKHILTKLKNQSTK